MTNRREQSPDVLVLGLGAMGAATAYRAAQRGLSVVGLDRHHPPHAFGSTHGESRITRLAIGEGRQFVPLVIRSHDLWREMEAESGASLLHACGGLWITNGSGVSRLHDQADFFGNTLAAAREFGIAHELLDAGEMRARHPRFRLRGDERGYFEPGAGYLDPEACVATQLQLARRAGAELLFGDPALQIGFDAGKPVVSTATSRFTPRWLVVAAGAWLPGLMPDLARDRFVVRRQVMHWFAAESARGNEPVFIWHWGEAEDETFYGFPVRDGAMKTATEQRLNATTPDAVLREVSESESRAMHARHVDGRLVGVTPQAVRAASCLYTNAPGANFIVDALPSSPATLVVSACSGHGFKHSAAIGEALASWMADGQRPAVLEPFSLS